MSNAILTAPMMQRVSRTLRWKQHRAYNQVFETPAGQSVLADLLKTAGADKTTYVPGDSHATAFNEGKRAMVLRILNTMQLDPSDIVPIIQENEEHE